MARKGTGANTMTMKRAAMKLSRIADGVAGSADWVEDREWAEHLKSEAAAIKKLARAVFNGKWRTAASVWAGMPEHDKLRVPEVIGARMAAIGRA